MNRILAKAVAVLGPAVVLGLACLVLQARVGGVKSRVALQMEAELAARPPDIVVIGNSTSFRAIQPGPLAQALGQDLAVTNLWVAGSGAATWYAILKHRVYGNGYQPRLVLIPGFYEHFVGTGTFGNDTRITHQVVDDDPVILRKTFKVSTGSPFFFRLTQGRDALRETFFANLRNGVTGLFFGEGGGSLVERGEKPATDALTRVFSAEGAVDLTLNRRAVPIVEQEREQVGGQVSDRVEDSYLGDIVELARSQGTQVVFVYLPSASSDKVYRKAGAPEKRALVAYLNELGAGWIDLTSLGITDGDFTDAIHLSMAAGARTSAEIGRQVLEMGALLGDTLPRAALPIAPSRVERVGTPPALGSPPAPTRTESTACGWRVRLKGLFQGVAPSAALPLELTWNGQPLTRDPASARSGERCAGTFHSTDRAILYTPPRDEPDGSRHGLVVSLSPQVPFEGAGDSQEWWVYPGTSVRFTLQGAWDPLMGPFGASLLGVRYGAGQGQATFTVGDAAGVPITGTGPWVQAALESAPPAGSTWQVQVSSPADGPYLLLRTLSLGQGRSRVFLVGANHMEQGSSQLFLGRANNRGVEFTWATPPPDLPQGAMRIRGTTGTLAVPELDFLLRSALPDMGDGNNCDPVRFQEGGQMWGPMSPSCAAPREGTPGTWCHRAGQLMFAAPGGKALLKDGVQRGAVLDPTRECAKAFRRWLYPGDTLTMRLESTRFLVGADSLVVRGYDLPATGDGPLRMALRVGEQEVFSKEVLQSQLREIQTWELPGRVPSGRSDVIFQVSNPSPKAWFILAHVELVERRLQEELPLLGE